GVASTSAPEAQTTSLGRSRQQQGQQSEQAKASSTNLQMVSLTDPGAVQAAAVDRKIIRNAELAMEIDSPAEAQRKIAAIAEAHGGFVVTSEFKQHEGGIQAKANTTISIVVRVPASQFETVKEKIYGIGGHISQDK